MKANRKRGLAVCMYGDLADADQIYGIGGVATGECHFSSKYGNGIRRQCGCG